MRRVWILNMGVARRIVKMQLEWQHFPINEVLYFLAELFNFLSYLWVCDFPHWLLLKQTFFGFGKKAFNRVD